MRIPAAETAAAASETGGVRISTGAGGAWFRAAMNVLVVLIALTAAWWLLRMWEATGEPPEAGDASAAPAAEPAEAWVPPAPSVRVVTIVVGLVAAFAYYVGIPVVVDGILGGGDDGSEPIGCVTVVDDAVRPGGAPVLQVSFEACD